MYHPEEHHKALVYGLLNDDENITRLYHKNASFHHTVELLANLLPCWIFQLADLADEEEVSLRNHIKDMEVLNDMKLNPPPEPWTPLSDLLRDN